MNIEELMSAKSKKLHLIKRYIKFIKTCSSANCGTAEYLENHHILPKAIYPEYKNFKLYEWNLATLTSKQHIIAHVMLWKIFGGSQASALHCMLFQFNANTNKLLKNRKIPNATFIRHAANVRKEAYVNTGKYHIGKSTYVDSTGKRYYIETNSPLIAELGLVHIKQNTKVKDRSVLIASGERRRKATLHFLDMTIRVKYQSSEYHERLCEGWTPELTKEDSEYRLKLTTQRLSEARSDKSLYATPDGKFFGLLKLDDPSIQELGLITYSTDKNREQWKNWTQAATDAKLGTNIWNNGKDEKFSIDCPGDGWSLGRAPRREDWEKNRIVRMREVQQGKHVYNNGVDIIYITPGDVVPPGYVRGMKPQKKRMLKYTDGINTIKCYPEDAPEGYVSMNAIARREAKEKRNLQTV